LGSHEPLGLRRQSVASTTVSAASPTASPVTVPSSFGPASVVAVILESVAAVSVRAVVAARGLVSVVPPARREPKAMPATTRITTTTATTRNAATWIPPSRISPDSCPILPSGVVCLQHAAHLGGFQTHPYTVVAATIVRVRVCAGGDRILYGVPETTICRGGAIGP
jgi:hypothetical protein